MNLKMKVFNISFLILFCSLMLVLDSSKAEEVTEANWESSKEQPETTLAPNIEDNTTLPKEPESNSNEPKINEIESNTNEQGQETNVTEQESKPDTPQEDQNCEKFGKTTDPNGCRSSKAEEVTEANWESSKEQPETTLATNIEDNTTLPKEPESNSNEPKINEIESNTNEQGQETNVTEQESKPDTPQEDQNCEKFGNTTDPNGCRSSKAEDVTEANWESSKEQPETTLATNIEDNTTLPKEPESTSNEPKINENESNTNEQGQETNVTEQESKPDTPQENQTCEKAGKTADPNDCRSYNTCLADPIDGSLKMTKKKCQENEAFNEHFNTCSRDITSCNVGPECLVRGKQADPSSETSFFWCAENYNKNGFRKYHVQCRTNELFVPTYSDCVQDISLPFVPSVSVSDEELAKVDNKLLNGIEKQRVKYEKRKKKEEEKLLKQEERRKRKAAKKAKKAAQKAIKEQAKKNKTDKPISCIKN
ncbi:hypothetical protein ACFFRR_002658 [Megaselia abdita]